MRNLRMWVSLVGLSVAALATLRYFPGEWVGEDFHLNSIVSYSVVAIVFYVAIYFLGLPTLEFFRFPRIHLKTLFALAVVMPGPVVLMTDSNNHYKSVGYTISSIIFLLVLGFGEEMLSRGFTYGVLRKFGQLKAIFISSLLFGLLHINVYFPDQLGWATYGHVMSAFGMGLVLCGLMIVTRSIWVSVIYHAMIDWSIPFEKVSKESYTDDTVYSLWDNLTSPFFELIFYVAGLAILLMINRASVKPWMYRLAKRFEPVAVKWKLVEHPADNYRSPVIHSRRFASPD